MLVFRVPSKKIKHTFDMLYDALSFHYIIEHKNKTNYSRLELQLQKVSGEICIQPQPV